MKLSPTTDDFTHSLGRSARKSPYSDTTSEGSNGIDGSFDRTIRVDVVCLTWLRWREHPLSLARATSTAVPPGLPHGIAYYRVPTTVARSPSDFARRSASARLVTCSFLYTLLACDLIVFTERCRSDAISPSVREPSSSRSTASSRFVSGSASRLRTRSDRTSAKSSFHT